jgi:hypothetical protein
MAIYIFLLDRVSTVPSNKKSLYKVLLFILLILVILLAFLYIKVKMLDNANEMYYLYL